MLGKLLKLDLRFAYKKYLGMAAILIAAGIVMPWLLDTTAYIGSFGVLIAGLLIVGILSVWFVVEHYYRNLFLDEGYLMFTLPVTHWQLLASKAITAVFWFNLMLCAAVGMALLISREGFAGRSFLDIFSAENIEIGLEMIFAANIIAIPSIFGVFMGISVSTLPVRNRSLGLPCGIIIGCAAVWLYNWSSAKLGRLSDEGFFGSFWMSEAGARLFDTAAALIFSAVFCVITVKIMKHRLNLK